MCVFVCGGRGGVILTKCQQMREGGGGGGGRGDWNGNARGGGRGGGVTGMGMPSRGNPGPGTGAQSGTRITFGIVDYLRINFLN